MSNESNLHKEHLVDIWHKGQDAIDSYLEYPLCRLVKDVWLSVNGVQPQLPYHNSAHVLSVLNGCIDIATQIGLQPKSASLLLAAIAHDVIYIPGFENNEEASSRWLSCELASLYTDFQNIERSLYEHVRKVSTTLIAGTTLKWHVREVNEGLHFEPLHGILLDADLASLADDYDTFKLNQANILKEMTIANPYSSIEVNISRRKTFLRSLLKRDTIYVTSYYIETRENKTRENILQFCDSLVVTKSDNSTLI